MMATVIVLALLPAGGCSSSDDDGQAEAGTGAAGAAVYLVPSDGQWKLIEGYDPSPENTRAAAVEASLDWYAEYDAPPAESPRHVRLSGHDGDLDQVAGEVEGFTLEPSAVGSYEALSGTSPEPDGRPAVVVFGVRRDYSVMALSYELTADELVGWSEDLEVVTESEWEKAGGKVDR